ncbi:hypothetical protein FRC20_002385 [Serendipita sp. 405]|nr:hypothetical protein FRC20_002385 [Serendipita sp. 405]
MKTFTFVAILLSTAFTFVAAAPVPVPVAEGGLVPAATVSVEADGVVSINGFAGIGGSCQPGACGGW